MIFCLNGLGNVHNTNRSLKHFRKRIEILLAFFFTTWLSLHDVLIRGKPAILLKAKGGVWDNGVCLGVRILPFVF